MGTPIREPQEYSRSILGIYLQGSLRVWDTIGVIVGILEKKMETTIL